MREFVRQQIQNSLGAVNRVRANEAIHTTLVAEAERIATALRRKGKLMIAGNGGSAADAQHLAAEFVSRLTIDRPALYSVALTTDTSILTAVGNVYAYERVFQRQIEAIGQPEDVLLAISTSGNSRNILCALGAMPQHGKSHDRLYGRERRQDDGSLRRRDRRTVRNNSNYPGSSPDAGAYSLWACGTFLLRSRAVYQ